MKEIFTLCLLCGVFITGCSDIKHSDNKNVLSDLNSNDIHNDRGFTKINDDVVCNEFGIAYYKQILKDRYGSKMYTPVYSDKFNGPITCETYKNIHKE
jgi:hypothetical protein